MSAINKIVTLWKITSSILLVTILTTIIIILMPIITPSTPTPSTQNRRNPYKA